ncbi:hypothetical protein [Streptomyces sp. NPDC001492]
MSETSPNQGLFRLYAFECLIAAAFVIVIAFTISDVPHLGIAIYLGIGAVLWVVDMVLTGGRPADGHGLSHAVLVAAFALMWPLVVAALIGYVGLGVVDALRR